MVDSFVQVGIIATEEDVFVSGIDVPDIGLLEDSFRLPSKRYEGDDLEGVVARMMMAVAKVDADACLGDVVYVQVQLGC